MKIEGWLFAGGTVFFGLASIIYFLVSQEPVGTVALAFAAGLAFLVGFYVLFTARRIEPRPEDRPNAEVSEGAGEVGFYSPHSWSPILTAAGAGIIALGVAFGWWLVYIGVIWLGLAIIGFVFEYYRGEHAH